MGDVHHRGRRQALQPPAAAADTFRGLQQHTGGNITSLEGAVVRDRCDEMLTLRCPPAAGRPAAAPRGQAPYRPCQTLESRFEPRAQSSGARRRRGDGSPEARNEFFKGPLLVLYTSACPLHQTAGTIHFRLRHRLRHPLNPTIACPLHASSGAAALLEQRPELLEHARLDARVHVHLRRQKRPGVRQLVGVWHTVHAWKHARLARPCSQRSRASPGSLPGAAGPAARRAGRARG